MSKQYFLILSTTLAFLLAGNISTSSAAAPVLMVLEHVENGKIVRTGIEAKRGEAPSPTRGKGFDKWKLFPGSTFKTDAQPPEAVVDFYQGTDTGRVLLYSINIRYFRNSSNTWVPHYQVHQDVFAVRDRNGHWQPATTSGTSLIALTSITLPNADGFYPSFEFGVGGGLLQIDSWVVR